MEYKIIKDIIEKLNKYEITVDEKAASKLYDFYRLLAKKNETVNLTAITDYESFMSKHIIDSLILEKYIDTKSIKSMIDMGSGAGFPGIPLKIANDNINMVSIDSVNKKIQFQNEVIAKLEISGMKAIHCRAEDAAADPEMREKFQVCVSRAVADLRVLSEYCLPFVEMNGLFIAYKSGNVDVELALADKAISVLGGKVIGVEKFEIEGMNRSFVIIEKVKHTPERYPRKAGVPVNHPITG